MNTNVFLDPFPRSIALESSAVCNARCIFCPLFQGGEKMRGQKAFMDNVLFAKLVEELAQWPTLPDIIALNGRGEPLLDKGFKEKVAILKQYGLSQRAVILTNAEFLTEEMALLLCEAPVKVLRPTLDSARKEIFERTRVGCHFETVRDNIINFAKLRTAMGAHVKIQVQHICTTYAETEDAEAVYALLRPYMAPNDEIYMVRSFSWASPQLAEQPYILNKPGAVRVRNVCSHLKTDLSVFSDGRVPSCCLDYNFNVLSEGLGNTREESLLSIWRGAKRRALAEAIASGDPVRLPVYCSKCGSLFNPGTLPPMPANPGIPIRMCTGGYMMTFA